MIRQRPPARRAADLRGVQEPRKHDGAGALDVVVEEREARAVALEVRERLVRREVLELDEEFGEGGAHFVHEFVHELVELGERAPLLAQAEVERVVEELLGVGAGVEADGHGGLGADAVGEG